MSGDDAKQSGSDATVYECSVCLCSCVYPVKLPNCGHIFCFLCIKGVASRSTRCPMCRSVIPVDYLNHPQVLEQDSSVSVSQQSPSSQWFYQGRQGGWWQYDQRTNTDIDDAFVAGKPFIELLIAGHMYVIDLQQMVQYRKDQSNRKRKIKRDSSDAPDTKGVAGITNQSLPKTDIDKSKSDQDERKKNFVDLSANDSD